MSCWVEGKSELMGSRPERLAHLTQNDKTFTLPSRFSVSSNPLPYHQASLFHQTLNPGPRTFWNIPQARKDHGVN